MSQDQDKYQDARNGRMAWMRLSACSVCGRAIGGSESRHIRKYREIVNLGQEATLCRTRFRTCCVDCGPGDIFEDAGKHPVILEDEPGESIH